MTPETMINGLGYILIGVGLMLFIWAGINLKRILDKEKKEAMEDGNTRT